jgi:hypothetical protein
LLASSTATFTIRLNPTGREKMSSRLKEVADPEIERMLEAGNYASNRIDVDGVDEPFVPSSSSGHHEGRTGHHLHQTLGSIKELRLNVCRLVLWMSWGPKYPRCWEAPRPESFPPRVTVFHTGLVHTAYCQAKMSSVDRAKRGPAFFGIGVLFVIPVVASVLSLGVLVAALAHGKGSSVAASLVGCMLLGIFFSLVALGLRDRLLISGIDMDALIRELAPAFRVAGYDLEFCSPGRWYHPFCEWYFRVAPFPAGAVAMLSAEERSEAESILKPLAAAGEGAPGRAETAISVAVYGPNAASLTQSVLSFVSNRSYDAVKHRIDMGTWGAVATEMLPLTAKYLEVRPRAAMILLLSPAALLVSLPGPASWTGKPWAVPLMLLPFFIHTFCPTFIETWWLDRVLKRSVLEQMRVKVNQLSALVEERSGYALRFETRPESCFGGVGGYVHFELSPGASAAISGDCDVEEEAALVRKEL